MELAKTLQVTLNRKANPKTDMYVDIAQSISGVLLVGFLWMHMLFVATIIVSPELFNKLSEGLDKYYLAQFGIPATILLIIIHIFLAGRRAPLRLRDLRITWRLTRMMGHFDTWIWVGQVVTALAVGIMASMHLWTIMSNWPIRAATSAARVAHVGPADPAFGGFTFPWMMVFYVIFLLVGEYHAGFGLYRIFVKWGWFERHKMGYVLKAITVIIVVLGITALYTFKKLAGGAL
ncbi:MAG: succinate dehydrogenase [Pelotomaculum sp.]|uniref:Succinate dehydrogenase/fumarate reductase, cytochrome b subunit n=1 Tax=Pelotomaculum thermopropionicum (strain DSM 13744 / JCM 10971 / SI) TaxID=370438 RepID=A5D3J0_PELTS|nr:succinate dehydrogenase [Pelotomaculum sp.]BAF59197.1 succinate dehydrogenase/fumarate reductase, cytochrome b subunit [Pelotomaculum thermopropionicum SI]